MRRSFRSEHEARFEDHLDVDSARFTTRRFHSAGRDSVHKDPREARRVALLREFDRIGLAAFKDSEKGDGLRPIPWARVFGIWHQPLMRWKLRSWSASHA